MDLDNETIIYILLGLLLASIALNIFQSCNLNCKETFCTCQDVVSKRCPSPQVLTDLYNKGILTENSDLKNIDWREVMPYDIYTDESKVTK